MKITLGLLSEIKRYISLLVLVPALFSTPVFADPPAQSGPNVTRGAIPLFYFYTDNGMLAIHGIDIEADCNSGTFPPNFDLWEVKGINNPAADDLTMGFINARDITTSVYPEGLFEFYPDGSIDPFATCLKIFFDPNYQQPIASGAVNVVAANNNSSVPPSNQNRAHRGQFSAHGKLFTPDGERKIFSGGFGCVVDGPEQSCYSRISLQ